MRLTMDKAVEAIIQLEEAQDCLQGARDLLPDNLIGVQVNIDAALREASEAIIGLGGRG